MSRFKLKIEGVGETEVSGGGRLECQELKLANEVVPAAG
jgi:hypothetical protein